MISTRKFTWAALAGIAAAGLTVGIALGRDDRNDDTFTYSIGLWGDLPYSDEQALTGVPNLIADMNRSNIEFSVHDGDLKAGNGTPGSVTTTTCADALYTQALGCFNSLERLDHERSVLFGTPFSLGRHALRQEVQSTPLCPSVAAGGLAPCVENRRWTFRGVTYATLNVQGSCNNLCDTNPDAAEFAGRNQADIAWLQQTFADAKAKGTSAVMLISQADPGFDQSDATRAPLRDPRTLVESDGQPDGFHDVLTAVRRATIDFRGPVAYVHGDSHYFRLDHPLLDAQGRRLENFTRVETFGDNQANGDNDVQWLKVLVDPNSRDVFAFQPQIVPANRVAVPAP